MIAITLENVHMQVLDGHGPAGAVKVIRFVDQQSGVAVVVPLDEAGKRALVGALHGVQLPGPPLNGAGA